MTASLSKTQLTKKGFEGIKTDFFYGLILDCIKNNFWRLRSLEKRLTKKIRDIQLAREHLYPKTDPKTIAVLDVAIESLRIFSGNFSEATLLTAKYANNSLSDLKKASECLRTMQTHGYGEKVHNAMSNLKDYIVASNLSQAVNYLLNLEAQLVTVIGDMMHPELILKCFDVFDNDADAIKITIGVNSQDNNISSLLNIREIFLTSIPEGYLSGFLPDLVPIKYDFSNIKQTVITLRDWLGLVEKISEEELKNQFAGDADKKARSFEVIQNALISIQDKDLIKRYKDRTIILHFIKNANQDVYSTGENLPADTAIKLIMNLEIQAESEDGDFVHCKVTESENRTITKMLTLPKRNAGEFIMTSHATAF